tara:strand:+ start:129 stop:437 length:309 start_codon:yes stop_codon:yes gene_type:complete
MSNKEGEIAIASEWAPYSPPKLLYIVILIAVIGLLWSSSIQGGMSEDCEEISNRDSEDLEPYEGYGCGYVEMINLCCVIIPLLFSFILLLMWFKGKATGEEK